MLRAEIRKRETLYGEFISECSARIIDSFERTLEKPGTLLQAYALLNRIRLCASGAGGSNSAIHHRTILLSQSFGRGNA